MKSFVRILSLVLVCILAMSLISCGSKPAEPAEPATPADDFDWSAYPADYNEWTTENMKTYLLAREVLGNDDFMLLDMSAELEQMSADSGFLYVDATAFTVNDTIIHFDANDEAGSAMLDTIRSEHAIVVGEASVPMDALVGAFAVSYSNSLDEEHVAKIVDAFNALAAHYEITPDFIG